MFPICDRRFVASKAAIHFWHVTRDGIGTDEVTFERGLFYRIHNSEILMNFELFVLVSVSVLSSFCFQPNTR